MPVFQGQTFPTLSDKATETEVRKALIDLLDKLNENYVELDSSMSYQFSNLLIPIGQPSVLQEGSVWLA